MGYSPWGLRELNTTFTFISLKVQFPNTVTFLGVTKGRTGLDDFTLSPL